MLIERLMLRAGRWTERVERLPPALKSIAVGLLLLLLLVCGVGTTAAAASPNWPTLQVSDTAPWAAPSEHRAHARRSKKWHAAAAWRSRKRRHALRPEGIAGHSVAHDLAVRAADESLPYLYRVYGAEPR